MHEEDPLLSQLRTNNNDLIVEPLLKKVFSMEVDRPVTKNNQYDFGYNQKSQVDRLSNGTKKRFN